MAQYQSFPGAAGDSLTLDKLKALRLPDLAGRSFLDIGCNEGFFCGFADFQGASRSVGVDHSKQFIERARRRFPHCEFHQQDWATLPEGPFDTILLASALHYADDQPALLHRLVDQLTPDGMLILELGIVTSKSSEWVKVKRGIDERYFPTMPMLREVLKDYAWKWMGPSITQSGDPVSRHVLHISRRRPIAYLLLQPPAYGKTSIAQSLFAPAHVPMVSGDHLLGLVVKGTLDAPEELRQSLSANYSPFALDKTIQRVFDEGLGEQLAALWLSQAKTGDFALDAYVPVEHHATVERFLKGAGYLPVLFRWERVGLDYLPTDELARRAETFYLAMAEDGEGSEGSGAQAKRKQAPMGFVDEMTLAHGQLMLRGWAVDEGGSLPSALTIRLADMVFVADVLQKQMRPDVQRHLDLAHGLVGFRLQVPIPGMTNVKQINGILEVFSGRESPPRGKFQLSSEVSAQLRETRGS
ncbi:MAG: class I SAM-dependent methyltransferase [Pseudomonadota bacterium]|nr:class I SAM-dependent methyltransferase [Pseudomonadota bacterium]